MMQSSSKILIALAALAFVQIASSLPVGSHGSVAKKGDHPFEERSNVVHAILIAVHANLEQRWIVFDDEEQFKIDIAIESSIDQSISHNASPAEIAEQVKQTVADLIAMKHDLPLDREADLWSALQRDVEEAARDNLFSIEDSIENVSADEGSPVQEIEPVAREDVVDGIVKAVEQNLERKKVPLSEGDKDEMEKVIHNIVEPSISLKRSPAQIAEIVKEAVADLFAMKHDLPSGRQDAFWSSLRIDAEKAAQTELSGNVSQDETIAVQESEPVARQADQAAEEMAALVTAVQNAVHRNWEQKMVPLTGEEEDEVKGVIKSSVEQSISQNASPAEIAGKAIEAVEDYLAMEHDLPMWGQDAFWSALRKAAEEAARNPNI